MIANAQPLADENHSDAHDVSKHGISILDGLQVHIRAISRICYNDIAWLERGIVAVPVSTHWW